MIVQRLLGIINVDKICGAVDKFFIRKIEKSSSPKVWDPQFSNPSAKIIYESYRIIILKHKESYRVVRQQSISQLYFIDEEKNI